MACEKCGKGPVVSATTKETPNGFEVTGQCTQCGWIQSKTDKYEFKK